MSFSLMIFDYYYSLPDYALCIQAVLKKWKSDIKEEIVLRKYS